MVQGYPKWSNGFEDWKVEMSAELSSSCLVDKDTFRDQETMSEETTAWGKGVENVMPDTSASSLMTFYPDMRMVLSIWSQRNVLNACEIGSLISWSKEQWDSMVVSWIKKCEYAGELPIITIGINCHIINVLEWTDSSQDYCPVVEGCCHILRGLERLSFQTVFNRVYNNSNKKEVIRITVLEIHRSKVF